MLEWRNARGLGEPGGGPLTWMVKGNSWRKEYLSFDVKELEAILTGEWGLGSRR